MKCLSIDLDGTFLSSNHSISSENIEAVKKAKENGVEVIFNTGRDLPEVLSFPEIKELKTPIICMNGTKIFSNNHSLLYEVNLPINKYVLSMNILIKENLNVITFTNKGMFIEENHEIPYFYEKDNVQKINYQKLIEQDDLIIYKILCISDHKETILSAQEKVRKIQNINAFFSYVTCLEVTGFEATKGKALLHYQKLMNKKFDEIYSIGDGGNDVDQFFVSSASAAMENAPSYIKEKATFVTKSNDHHGVAYAIEHLFKLNSV